MKTYLSLPLATFITISCLFSSKTFGQDYRGQDISTQDLSGTDLSSAQFDSTTIFSSGGSGVNLSGTNAVLQDISGAIDFTGVNLASVSFQNSDLSTATFGPGTIFSEYDSLSGQQMAVNFAGTNAVLQNISGGIDFTGVNLA
ncbi:MAG: hypothetical protein EBS74_06670, partial [Flavobacteriia bacterium]|nr:hypothetical protein [Flavobacteriia bacterium]